MSGSSAVALGEAVAGALGYGAASVVQARAARGAAGLGVVVRPWYVAGLVADLVAWVASVLAMRVLPLFVVQSLLATSLAVTVLLAWPVLGHRPDRRDAVAVAVAMAALAGLAWSAGSDAPHHPGPLLLVAVGIALVLGGAWFLVRLRTGGGVEHAVIAGWAFSWLAVCVRALPLPSGLLAAARAALLDPLAWAVLVFGVLGTLAFARAVERGRVGPVTVTLWVVEVVVSGAVGVLALGDHVRAGATWPAAVCTVAALAACVALGVRGADGSAGDESVQPGGEQPVRDEGLAGGVGVVAVRGEQVGDVPVRGRSVERGVEVDEGVARGQGRGPDDGVGLEGELPGGPESRG